MSKIIQSMLTITMLCSKSIYYIHRDSSLLYQGLLLSVG